MKNKKVFKNAAWIIGCKIAQAGFALVINALTARYFGPSNYGLINYAASLVAFVTPVATLGMPEILVNEIIEHEESEGEILGTAILMSVISSVICIAGLFVFVCVAHPEDRITPVVVGLYSCLLLSQSLEQIQYWFHAKYMSKHVSVISFFVYLMISIYKIVLLACEKGIQWFAVSYCIDYLLIAIFLMFFYKIKGGRKIFFSINYAKLLWDRGRYYIIPGVMGLVLAQSDRVMLRFMCGEAEVGFYSAALTITGLTSFVFAAIITAFRTLILESKAISQQQYENNITRLYGSVIYLALLQCIAITLFARLGVNILYGEEYFKAVPILCVAVWYTLFSYIGGVRAVWILAEDMQRYLWWISFFGMITNVLLNMMLIPRMSGLGAAVATTITQIITNIVIVYVIKPLRPNIIYILKSLNLKRLANL